MGQRKGLGVPVSVPVQQPIKMSCPGLIRADCGLFLCKLSSDIAVLRLPILQAAETPEHLSNWLLLTREIESVNELTKLVLVIVSLNVFIHIYL